MYSSSMLGKTFLNDMSLINKEVIRMAKAQLKPDMEEIKTEAEVTAYRRLYESVKTKLTAVSDKINTQTIKNVVDKAGAEMKEAGEHSTEMIKRLTQALKKDIASSAARLGPNWERLKGKTHNMFDIWQDRGTIFIGHAALSVGDWLHDKGDKLEHHIYHAGELTYGGSFECSSCGERLEINKANFIQPCPKCMKTEFRRI